MKRYSILLPALLPVILFSCNQAGQKKSESAQPAAVAKVEMVKTIGLNYEKIAHSVEYAATLQGYVEMRQQLAVQPGKPDKFRC